MTDSVDWQLKCTRLKKRTKFLLRSGQWADCIFDVGSNHQLIHAHKFILSMASPVFETMFHGSMPENDGPIIIEDVNVESFKALLKYIYLDSVDIASYVDACNLCYTAKKYMMPHLEKKCVEYLCSNVDSSNFCYIYECAVLFDETLLLKKCIKLMRTCTKPILQHRSLISAKIETIATIFSQDVLTIDSELDLFNAAMRYYVAQENIQIFTRSSSVLTNAATRKRKFTDTSEEDEAPEAVQIHSENSIVKDIFNDSRRIKEGEPNNNSTSEDEPLTEEKVVDTDFEDVKVMIRSLVKDIRFLTLTSTQFASGPARSPLLTEGESFAILMNIVKRDCGIPLPNGLSTSRISRGTVDCLGSRPEDWPVQLEGRQLNSHLYSHLVCRRLVSHQMEYINDGVMRCSVTFSVNRRVIVHGVQVPTQVPHRELPLPEVPTYQECVYIELQDEDGVRLTFAHSIKDVPFRAVQNIIFNKPIYVLKDKMYRILVDYNKIGWYPVGPASLQICSNSVLFRFNIEPESPMFAAFTRDGAIRSILFSIKPIEN